MAKLYTKLWQFPVTAFVLHLLAKGALGVIPRSQTVNELQVFVFPCSSPSADILPTWIINGVHYFPSELPSNYYVNETGLVGVARAEINQSIYQCVFVTISLVGGFISIDDTVTDPPAILTVLESDVHHNDTAILPVPGPFVLEVAYNGMSPDLLLRWKPQANVTIYNIQLVTCGGSMLMEAPVNSSCLVSQLSGVNFTEYGLLLVAVKSCAMNGCGVPATMIAIDFTNTDLVQEVTTDIVYATNARICLFQSKLYNIDTASGLGVLVVEGDNYVQYRVFGSTKQLPAYLQLTYTHPMLQICTTPNQDIRSIVRAEFGDVDKVTVTEVLEIPNTCENGQPFNVKYFGRSVRLVLNSTETNTSSMTTSSSPNTSSGVTMTTLSSLSTGTTILLTSPVSTAIPTPSSSGISVRVIAGLTFMTTVNSEDTSGGLPILTGSSPSTSTTMFTSLVYSATPTPSSSTTSPGIDNLALGVGLGIVLFVIVTCTVSLIILIICIVVYKRQHTWNEEISAGTSNGDENLLFYTQGTEDEIASEDL